MGKTITIEDDAYRLLSSLKQGPGDSFTKVIRRHVYSPLETGKELIDVYEQLPPPDVDLEILRKVTSGRGRKSNRRK
jgi:predicted CopG family antitoxin